MTDSPEPTGDDHSFRRAPRRALSAAEAYRLCLPTQPAAPAGSGLRVAVLHNLARCAPLERAEHAPDALDELDNERNVSAYVHALRSAGHTVYDTEGDAGLSLRLAAQPVDICFNTCEGFTGDSREAQVPALLEMLGVPYSGGQVMCLANTLDKAATKRIFQAQNLPTPAFQEFFHPGQLLDSSLQFPLFVKPNREGTGIGIEGDSRVEDENQLRERVAYILERYGGTALVEEYVPGRDVTVALIGNLDSLARGQPTPSLAGLPETPGGGLDWNGLHLFPLSEINYGGYPPGTEPFYSHRLKVDWADDYSYFCPAPLPPALTAEVRRLAVEAFRVTACLDFARVDFRLSAEDRFRPTLLEINALPGVTPTSDLTLVALAEGWTYPEMINAVLDAAIQRYGLRRVDGRLELAPLAVRQPAEAFVAAG